MNRRIAIKIGRLAHPRYGIGRVKRAEKVLRQMMHGTESCGACPVGDLDAEGSPYCCPNRKSCDAWEGASTAILAAESHVAAAGLLQSEIKLIRELRDEGPQEKELPASQAGPALVEAVMDAPRVTQWEIYQRLAELPGFADGDEEDEEEPEERPPLRAVRGGKK